MTDELSTKDAFREAMARLGAAVNIITTDGPAGRHGFTASAVCSVTDSPPTVIVCVNRSGSADSVIADNGVLSVNILGEGDSEISRRFSSRLTIKERFADVDSWGEGVTGSPVFRGAVAVLDCEIDSVVEHGSHNVYFCRIKDILLGEAMRAPLMYFNRTYHSLVELDHGKVA